MGTYSSTINHLGSWGLETDVRETVRGREEGEEKEEGEEEKKKEGEKDG